MTADGSASKKRRGSRMEQVMQELIVERGLSYVDAIAECERRAESAAAPYLNAAFLLREEMVRLRPAVKRPAGAVSGEARYPA